MVLAVLPGCTGTGFTLPPSGLSPAPGNPAGAETTGDATAGATENRAAAASGVVAGAGKSDALATTNSGPSNPTAPVTCGTCRIVGFKPQMVTLYLSEGGQEAQRIPRTAMQLPILAASGKADRLQIMTLDGLRWVASSDVQLDAGSR